jgi:hypothetical protein
MADRPRKRELTFHEKQMQFFTRLLISLGAVTTALVVWLMNSSVFSHH